MEEGDRKMYGEILMSGVDDTLMKKHHNATTVGSAGFAGKLKVQRGRYRLMRGRPVRSV